MSENEIAIRVANLSKTYHLWNSPRDRLVYPLRWIAHSMLPALLRPRAMETRGYHEFHALNDVSLEIRKGESWGIIGVNGSGKSTLLKVISGNLRPSAGIVEVEGKTAILDYGSGLNGDFTGRENVYMKGSLLGLSKRQIDEKFESIEAFAEIGEFIDQPVKTYSSGMSARLGFAIMAHVDADILITDEALAVGDALFVQKCMRHLRDFLSRGTFLFVSHSINDVMMLCDKAVFLEQGRIVKMGSAKDVCRAYMDSLIRKNADEGDRKEITARGNAGRMLAAKDAEQNSDPAPSPAQRDRDQSPEPRHDIDRVVCLSSDELARLKNHFAPRPAPGAVNSASRIEVVETDFGARPRAESAAIVGGGRIFSVAITDEDGGQISALLGGEVVHLWVRAVAETRIHRPLVGFQIKNSLGLALVGENSHLAVGERDFSLRPGELLSARFTFAFPLLASGEYVIRAAFHDGDETRSVAVDVIEDALVVRCATAGPRHGLVGVPLLGMEIKREAQPQLQDR